MYWVKVLKAPFWGKNSSLLSYKVSSVAYTFDIKV